MSDQRTARLTEKVRERREHEMKRWIRGWLWKPYHRSVYGPRELPQPVNCVTVGRSRPDPSPGLEHYGRWVRIKMMEVET